MDRLEIMVISAMSDSSLFLENDVGVGMEVVGLE